ncbi:predicted protein [Chaetomium globosum CBS 148.51]|uniref:Uncharacterized protein n=1 Tax=Chaetomium globosum (strain ATCC 6205 / CBS 148.51 / DSM 1962 / NBRC 6347 / NRRL 1970) TaxID=306901 RepID=Q2H0V6_CHAGB|nr:uncharacterized protein CHGG_04590 [Chaetomium globosum CBS 148.51]EAQ87971.1 predicted protein [Chaetomium globosum CBS 148.51]
MSDDRKQSTASTNPESPTTQQFPKSGTGKEVAPLSPTSRLEPPADPARRGSDEWDASKVPPSRFQKRKGSIYAVPHSRDGKIDSNYHAKYFEKLAEMGYDKK